VNSGAFDLLNPEEEMKMETIRRVASVAAVVVTVVFFGIARGSGELHARRADDR